MKKKVYGLDIETHDPLLKTQGYSWKYNEGYILNIAVYSEEKNKTLVFAGLKNKNSPFNVTQRKSQNKKVENLLRDEEVIIIGANILYDIAWLLYEYEMKVKEVKATLIDVLQAEAILDEYSVHSLETLSQKYLKIGKKKDVIEEYVKEHIEKRGDFRQHLKEVPYDLLSEYVETDAVNPVRIWQKQFTLLKQENLVKRAKLEFDCILPTIQMTQLGLPIDVEQKQKNLEYLSDIVNKFEDEFKTKYNLPKFKITKGRDIAGFLDSQNIPYNYKITLKGYNGKKFSNGEETDRAYMRAKKIVSDFRLEKGKPVAFVPKDMASRTELLLTEENFMFTSSPNLGKNYFKNMRETFPVVAVLADWKSANGIISKFLGEKYNRFITRNYKDEDCVKAQYKITDTVSFRYSSNSPNLQQIMNKGELKLDSGEKVEFKNLTRKLFKASKGCVYGKIDYGQIEYRLICNVAIGETGKEVREAYKRNPKLDFHQYTMELTGLDRKLAKNMSFGISFGMGLKSMASSFGWTLEQAEEIAEKYHNKMPFVLPTAELIGDVAKDRGYIITVYGSHCRLKDKRKSYTMLNRYTQGSGAECLKASIVQAYKEGIWERLKVTNTIHDELGFPYLEPTEECMRDFYRMAEIMRTSVDKLRIPLEAEIELGENWAETETIEEWIRIRKEEKAKWNKLSAELKQSVNICEKLLKEKKYA